MDGQRVTVEAAVETPSLICVSNSIIRLLSHWWQGWDSEQQDENLLFEK